MLGMALGCGGTTGGSWLGPVFYLRAFCLTCIGVCMRVCHVVGGE